MEPLRNKLLTGSIVCFIAGWILLLGSGPFITKLWPKRTGKVAMSIEAKKYELMEDLLKIVAKGNPNRVSIGLIGQPRDRICFFLFVYGNTEGEAVASSDRLANQLVSEFARRDLEPPVILERAKPVLMVGTGHRILFAVGWIPGLLALGCSVVTAILFFRERKRIPPPLPGQEEPENAVVYDY